MKDLVKIILGNLAAQAILVSLFALGGVFFLVMMIASSGVNANRVEVPDGGVLVVDLWANISDAPPSRPLDAALAEALSGETIPNYYLLELIDALETAASDDRVEALFLHGSLLPEGYGSGLAAVSELRDALIDFKESGKPVYAYLVEPGIADYYLMSVADRIYANPFGLVSLNGLSAEGVYLGGFLDKYGIGVQATKAGKYKSAVEMFTGTEMSPADREQLRELCGDLWHDLLADIAEARRVSLEELLAATNNPGFFVPEQAKELGLIDRLAYFDEVIDDLQQEFEHDEAIDSFRQMSLRDYIGVEGFRANGAPLWGGPKVAVVYAEGEIVYGEGYPDQIGADRLARELRRLRQDDEVAAIVLRVNSPGGSAVASEIIQREVREAKATKPLVVSMGSYAASGGYWISAYADRIFAEPSTITGSIGVFGLVFNVKGLANEHGVTFDGVKTSEFADLFTLSRPKTPEEMALIQAFTDYLYDEFLRKVAEGRDLPLETVAELAQGRVWSGLDAHALGLVDEIGGLREAVELAVELADVEDNWTLIQVPEQRGLADTIAEFLERQPGSAPLVRAPDDWAAALLRQARFELRRLGAFNDPRDAYARMSGAYLVR